MPRGDGTGPQGLGPGTGRGRGKGRAAGEGREEDSGFNTGILSQKSTLGGAIFAFASMLFGNWLDKKLAERKTKTSSKKDKPDT